MLSQGSMAAARNCRIWHFRVCIVNAHKGPNIAGIDPSTGDVTRLFNPREDRWDAHFEWDGAAIAGRTAVGRVTVQVLGMNDPDFLDVRSALISEGAFRLQ